MTYYSLATGKLHKKVKTKKLNNLTINFGTDFYKNWLDIVDSSFGLNFKTKNCFGGQKWDVKDCPFATRKLGGHVKKDIDMYINCDRLNETSFRRKLHPIAKNVICRQNPLELVFKYNSTFDAQNPIWKRYLACNLVSKALNPVDIEIESRLQALKRNNAKNENYNVNNNFGGQPPPPLLPPPPTQQNNFLPEAPVIVLNFDSNFDFNQNVAANNNFNLDQQNNIQEQRQLRDDIIKRIDNVLGEKKMVRPPKINIDNNITSILSKAPEILDEQFLRNKELEQRTIQQLKNDFDFDENR